MFGNVLGSDDKHREQITIIAELLQDVEPARIRHMNVEDCQIKAILPNNRQCFLA